MELEIIEELADCRSDLEAIEAHDVA